MDGDARDLLQLLPSAPRAAFNASGKDDDPLCLPNTRLNGIAGTGKSTIARTIAREYYDKKYLGGSFFFSRSEKDVSHAGNFVGSIAVQLARFPVLKDVISDAISNHNGVVDMILLDQWKIFVLEPLSKLEIDSAWLIIVIDALDEFEKSDRQDCALHDISRDYVNQDIFTFLENKFEMIREKYQIGLDWPTKHDIRRLVDKAAGLFIWAATAWRYIDEGDQRFARKRLSDIIQDYGSITKSEIELNKIYIKVLENPVSPLFDKQEKRLCYTAQREILGTIINLYSPLSVSSLARLLQMPIENINRALAGLHSVLNIPEDLDRPICLYHPSFRDFLFDKKRCSDLHLVD
ncbi:MAG: hypothetical protein M1834_001330 [Cirrosporium novae-zelandiae]|nr:MAG: hypothetical protein M1834_001330 [Cirrosporium novae-zelandiae]